MPNLTFSRTLYQRLLRGQFLVVAQSGSVEHLKPLKRGTDRTEQSRAFKPSVLPARRLDRQESSTCSSKYPILRTILVKNPHVSKQIMYKCALVLVNTLITRKAASLPFPRDSRDKSVATTCQRPEEGPNRLDVMLAMWRNQINYESEVHAWE